MQEENKRIRAEANLARDFYLTLNASGREFFNLVLAQINQDCYLRSPDEIGEAQNEADARPAIKPVQGVESVPSEALRRINRQLRLSREDIEVPDGLQRSILQRSLEMKLNDWVQQARA